jgi:hypothetical protein
MGGRKRKRQGEREGRRGREGERERREGILNSIFFLITKIF